MGVVFLHNKIKQPTTHLGYLWVSFRNCPVCPETRTYHLIFRTREGGGKYSLDNINLIDITDIDYEPILENSAEIPIFVPDVLSYNDYYPFGMLVPNRNYSSPSYRYGFQGQEKDDEISGNGNSSTSFFRQFNLRLGRAFSLDPVQRAGQTMYSLMSNNPMIMVDPRGDDDYYNENGVYLYTDTKTSTDIRLITQAQFDKIQQN